MSTYDEQPRPSVPSGPIAVTPEMIKAATDPAAVRMIALSWAIASKLTAGAREPLSEYGRREIDKAAEAWATWIERGGRV